MAQFKFDGSKLYSKGSMIGRVDGSRIYDAHNTQKGRIDGERIYNEHSQIGHVEGNRIYDARSSQIGSLDDVRKVIDGPGGTILVALWLFFVR